MEENSTNALMIAAGVLISVMIISLAVYLFKSSADFAESYYADINSKATQAFNNKFEIYNTDEVTIQDMVSIANFARDTNIKNGVENDKNSSIYIQVILYNGSKHLETLDREDLYKFMEENTFVDNDPSKGEQMYKCKGIEYDENTQRVNKITFEEKR